MPRLTHHSSAQLIKTGTMMSSCNGPRFQRDTPAPTPTPILPPILMQVDDPSILKKPAPYSAQGFAAAFAGRSGSDLVGFSGLPPRNCCAGAADTDNTARTITGKTVRIRRILSRPARLCYRTNLTPRVLPRRQTTSQFLPVRASRENASRTFAFTASGSSTVIFAPAEDRSSSVHGPAAKPPSSVIHPDWRTDLRASRLLVIAIVCDSPAWPPALATRAAF